MTKPFPYYGGKERLGKWIIPMMPDHTTYVEAFGGSGSILFAKSPSKVEVYNDINGDLVNLFRVLRNDYDKFYWTLEYMPYSRYVYKHCEEELDPEDNIDRAVITYLKYAQSFCGGFGNGWGYSVVQNQARKYWNRIDRLGEVRDRLKGVQIDCRDAVELIKAFDSPETLFYLDPPYSFCTRSTKKGYPFEMSDQQHEALLDAILDVEGMVMLSTFDGCLYNALKEYGWRPQKLDRKIASANNKLIGQQRAKTEVVWMNPTALSASKSLHRNPINATLKEVMS